MDSHPGTTVNTEISSYAIDNAKIEELANLVCRHLGIGSHELSITFVDSHRIRELNREYRGKDKATDVLSFPQMEFKAPLTFQPVPATDAGSSDAPPRLLGDIVISLPEAATNAARIGQGLDREVCFLIVHGVLHLCGHDHEKASDETAMLKQQHLMMERIAAEATPPLWQNCVSQGGAV